MSTRNSITLPTIHRNGTGADSLEREYRAVRLAIASATGALERATCNPQDFYPQGPYAHGNAMAEREGAFRLLALVSAYAEAWEAHAYEAQRGEVQP
jgi:hypothetical protein